MKQFVLNRATKQQLSEKIIEVKNDRFFICRQTDIFLRKRY